VHVEPPLRGVVYFSTPISSGSAFRQAALLSGLSHASVVGANCLGHIFGIGAILGLASRGVL